MGVVVLDALQNGFRNGGRSWQVVAVWMVPFIISSVAHPNLLPFGGSVGEGPLNHRGVSLGFSSFFRLDAVASLILSVVVAVAIIGGVEF